MAQTESTLDIIYDNWRIYNDKLRDAIAPLTAGQLRLQPAPGMWPLQQLLQHIVGVRAGWFCGTLQEADEAIEAYMEWGQWESPPRTAAELAQGLDDTWAFIESRMRRWTAEDLAVTFPDETDEGVFDVSRSWVVYHVLEHDLHHGGEVSLLLGMNKLPGPNI